MDIIKRNWKLYLEELWYFNLLYWFLVFLDWYVGNDLELFRPSLIVVYVFMAGLSVWLKKQVDKNIDATTN